MRALLRSIGFNPTEEELGKIISSVDMNNDNKMELDEFLQMMALKLKDQDTMEELMQSFKIFDRDDNRLISSAELRVAFKALEGYGVSSHDIEQLIKDGDRDGDGHINTDEFLQLINPDN